MSFGAVDGTDDKLHALRVISECTMPGRWDELRLPHDNEIKMTGVIALDIESASAKISEGMPDDEDCDIETPVWGGVLPIETRYTILQPDELVKDGIEPSEALREMEDKTL